MSENAGVCAALVAAQAEFGAVHKSRTVTVDTRTGGRYSYAYAPLEEILAAVRPVLAKHGLAVTQILTTGLDGGPALETLLLHASGERLGGTVSLPASLADAKAFGSAITYWRWYALVALLGIATEEDDDGGQATAPAPQPAARFVPPPAATAATTTAALPPVITDKQRGLIWGKAKEKGVPEERLRELVLDVAGVESTKLIPRDRMEALLEALELWPTP